MAMNLGDHMDIGDGEMGCCDCGRMIAVGEPYGYSNPEELVMSAEPILYVTCLDCLAKAVT